MMRSSQQTPILEGEDAKRFLAILSSKPKQTKKNLWSIRFKHIVNSEGIEKALFEKRLKLLDRKKYLGFIEERTYITPRGMIIVKTDLIEGSPAKIFRESLKKAGLTSLDFTEK